MLRTFQRFYSEYFSGFTPDYMLDIGTEGILRVFAVIHMSYHRNIVSDAE